MDFEASVSRGTCNRQQSCTEVLYTIMSVCNSVPPEGLKVTSCHCWFLTLSSLCRPSDNIMHCLCPSLLELAEYNKLIMCLKIQCVVLCSTETNWICMIIFIVPQLFSQLSQGCIANKANPLTYKNEHVLSSMLYMGIS